MMKANHLFKKLWELFYVGRSIACLVLEPRCCDIFLVARSALFMWTLASSASSQRAACECISYRCFFCWYSNCCIACALADQYYCTDAAFLCSSCSGCYISLGLCSAGLSWLPSYHPAP